MKKITKIRFPTKKLFYRPIQIFGFTRDHYNLRDFWIPVKNVILAEIVKNHSMTTEDIIWLMNNRFGNGNLVNPSIYTFGR